MNQHIDHTNLKPNATESDIIKLCQEASKYGFRGVCILPYYVSLVNDLKLGAVEAKRITNANAFELDEPLIDSDLKISTVIDFPFGCSSQKVDEAKWAIDAGATELDVVWHQVAFANKRYFTVLKELNSIVKLDVPVKVIVEECNLSKDDLVSAYDIVHDSDAFCIKTSTGCRKSGARLSTIELWNSLGDLKIKASGGIHTRQQVIEFIAAGADIIGTSHGVEIMEESQ